MSVQPTPLRGPARRVLLVEPEPRLSDPLRIALADRGHRVRSMPSAESALMSICAERPDVVVTDVELPGMDGIGMMRLLRGDPLFDSLPVVAVAAREVTDARARALAAGAYLFVADPWDVHRVVALVEVIADLADLASRVAHERSRTEPETHPSTLLACAPLLDRFDEGVLLVRDGVIVACNAAATRLLRDARGTLRDVSRLVASLASRPSPGNGTDVRRMRTMRIDPTGPRSVRRNVLGVYRRGGLRAWARVRVVTLPESPDGGDHGGTIVVITLHDLLPLRMAFRASSRSSLPPGHGG